MSDADNHIEPLIKMLREVQALADQPKLLRAEIASLQAEHDKERLKLEHIRRELNDPLLNQKLQKHEARIQKQITDRKAELELLVSRTTKARMELDALLASCKEQRDYHDQIVDSIDSLKKQIGVA
jgi:chromosome segregation ATPase